MLGFFPGHLVREAGLKPNSFEFVKAQSLDEALSILSERGDEAKVLAGGQSLIAYALAHLPAAFSSLSLLVQPVAAAVLAWLILAEPIGPWQAAGGAIVLVGIAIARRGSMDRPAPSRR